MAPFEPRLLDKPRPNVSRSTVKWIMFILTVLVAAVGAFTFIFKDYKSSAVYSGRNIRVLAYSSLIGPWSAGPHLQKSFEAENGCKIEWIDGGDSRSVLQKLRTMTEPGAFDVVLGLDQFAIQEAREIEHWRALSVAKINGVTNPDSASPNLLGSIPAVENDFPWNSDLPQSERVHFEWQSFDWAPLTLVYREGEINPPKRLQDLATPLYEGQLAWVDPRASSVGFQFVAWIIALNLDQSPLNFLKQILSSRHSIIPSWSAAYGLFKKRQTKLAFSYLTSPVYHWSQEQDLTFATAPLEDSLPYQVEYAAVPSTCENCRDANAFIQFLKSPAAQTVLMKENYMLPIRADVIPGTLFEKLPHPRLIDPDVFSKIQTRAVLELWKQVGS